MRFKEQNWFVLNLTVKSESFSKDDREFAFAGLVDSVCVLCECAAMFDSVT